MTSKNPSLENLGKRKLSRTLFKELVALKMEKKEKVKDFNQ
jgi:hypothetical protein